MLLSFALPDRYSYQHRDERYCAVHSSCIAPGIEIDWTFKSLVFRFPLSITLIATFSLP